MANLVIPKEFTKSFEDMDRDLNSYNRTYNNGQMGRSKAWNSSQDEQMKYLSGVVRNLIDAVEALVDANR